MSIFYSKEQDGTMNVLVSGKVSREAEVRTNARGSKVRFSVTYGKSKYMNCEAWGDSDAGQIAGCLEKGDPVCVAGTYSEWEYNGKKCSALSVDGIFTPAMPGPPGEADLPPSSSTYEELSEDEDEDGELPF